MRVRCVPLPPPSVKLPSPSDGEEMLLREYLSSLFLLFLLLFFIFDERCHGGFCLSLT